MFKTHTISIHSLFGSNKVVIVVELVLKEGSAGSVDEILNVNTTGP